MNQGCFISFPVETTAHLLTACRDVERNPVRVDLVERAEQWCWSRAGTRGSVPLYAWPMAPPAEWPDWVNEGETHAQWCGAEQYDPGTTLWQPRVGGAEGRAVARGRDSARAWAAEEGADEHRFLTSFHLRRVMHDRRDGKQSIQGNGLHYLLKVEGVSLRTSVQFSVNNTS